MPGTLPFDTYGRIPVANNAGIDILAILSSGFPRAALGLSLVLGVLLGSIGALLLHFDLNVIC